MRFILIIVLVALVASLAPAMIVDADNIYGIAAIDAIGGSIYALMTDGTVRFSSNSSFCPALPVSYWDDSEPHEIPVPVDTVIEWGLLTMRTTDDRTWYFCDVGWVAIPAGTVTGEEMRIDTLKSLYR